LKHQLQALLLPLLFGCSLAFGQTPSFDGEWRMDLRSPEEQRANAECGFAVFKLAQRGTRISGEHSVAAVGCQGGDEGGAATVQGFVVGNSAVLTVTSVRNGMVVKGVASFQSGALHWRLREVVQAGQPAGNSGTILHKGILRKVAR
jgi:hypothetical protein